MKGIEMKRPVINSVMDSAMDLACSLVASTLPFSIVGIMGKRSQEMVSAESDIESYQKETVKQEIIAQQLIAQAKVEQELAIARRINISAEVAIEEYYDTSGAGDLGVKYNNEAGLTAGVHGEGRKITKRIYRFTGWNKEMEEIIQIMEDDGKLLEEPAE